MSGSSTQHQTELRALEAASCEEETSAPSSPLRLGFLRQEKQCTKCNQFKQEDESAGVSSYIHQLPALIDYTEGRAGSDGRDTVPFITERLPGLDIFDSDL